MIRVARVLLFTSMMAMMALAQGQPQAENQVPDQKQTTTQGPATSARPSYDYDGKPQPSPLIHPATEGPGTITVPAGTKIPLTLKNAISTKSARPGDGVYLQTIFPVSVNNTMVIPVGTYVQGVITSVKRPGRVSGRAEVLFRFTTLIYPDGYTFSIPGALNDIPGAEDSHIKDKEGTVQADSTKGRDVGTIVAPAATGSLIGAAAAGGKGAGIGGGIGAAAGIATVLLTRGNDVRIEQGSTVEMVLQRPLVLDDVNSHTHYYSGPPMSDSHRFTIPDRDRRNGERPVLTPAPER